MSQQAWRWPCCPAFTGSETEPRKPLVCHVHLWLLRLADFVFSADSSKGWGQLWDMVLGPDQILNFSSFEGPCGGSCSTGALCCQVSGLGFYLLSGQKQAESTALQRVCILQGMLTICKLRKLRVCCNDKRHAHVHSLPWVLACSEGRKLLGCSLRVLADGVLVLRLNATWFCERLAGICASRH